jgi:hypothetical protein
MKLSEIINRVIALATAIEDYWAVELPKRHPDYPVISFAEDFGPPPPEEKELRDFLKGLPAATIYILTFIMYLGRGDFGTEDLLERYEEMSDTFKKPEWAVSQMLGKGPLAEYLSNGLEYLSQANLNVDRLLEP